MRIDSKEKVIQKYIDDSKYGDYLKNLLTIMSSNTDEIVQDWKTYKDSFIQSSGNSNSSSLNMITNDFVYYFEKGLRANKIGIPAGVYSGGNTLVSNIEAYYSSKNSFEANNDNVSFIKDSYLQYNRIDPNKNFENFITGGSNKLAFEASKKVSKDIAHYNPCLLYTSPSPRDS